MRRARVLAAALLGTALVTGGTVPLLAQQADLKPLLGTFVGRAEAVDLSDHTKEQRDIDIVIAPYQRDGLKVEWTNVTLVDGRRDVPGVKRRRDEMLLVPAPDRSFFLAGVGYDPFQDRGDLDPLKGDPLRWGTVEAGTLGIYSFQILDDGRYELQVYERRPTEEGIELEYERIDDGEVARRMTGRAVRAGE
jgi:hypothetical protein